MRITLLPVGMATPPSGIGHHRRLNEVIRSVWRLRRPTAGRQPAAVRRTSQFHSMLSGRLPDVDRRFRRSICCCAAAAADGDVVVGTETPDMRKRGYSRMTVRPERSYCSRRTSADGGHAAKF
jgi:hypothetical protein